jgi:hypothetical protein
MHAAIISARGWADRLLYRESAAAVEAVAAVADIN